MLAVAGAVACALTAPAGALGAVGDLTFNGCIGMDPMAGCTQTSPASALNGADSVAISADGNSVYAAASSGSGAGLIDEFSRNASTGALTFVGCLGDGAGSRCAATEPANALDEPESVAVSADGKNAYVAAAAAGVLDVFSRNAATGALTQAGCVGNDKPCTPASQPNAVKGADSVALSADGTSVYVGAEGSLDVFSRMGADGAVKYESCIGEGEGCTPTTPKDAVAKLRSVAVSADGSSVYAANSSGMIDVFSRNASTGELAYQSCVGNASGSECAAKIANGALGGVGSLAVSADGASVYAASSGGPGPGGVVAFARTTSTGVLAYQGCFGAEVGCTATAPADALGQTVAVTASPDGNTVYSASKHSNSVGVFARNSANGELTYESCIGEHEGCAATTPADALGSANSVVVSADGSSVYATGGVTINQFSRATPGTPAVTCENITQNITFLFPTKITLKCSDTTGEPLSYAIVSNPAHGKLGPIGPEGTVTYTSSTLIPASDSFTYMASDSKGPSNVATVTLNGFVLSNKPRSFSGTGTFGEDEGPAGPRRTAGEFGMAPQTTRATLDNQRITLTTPSLLTCTPKTVRLAVALKSKAIPRSRAPKLRFASAAFYIDKGIRHTRKKTILTLSGHRKTVTVVAYTANATGRRVPMTLALSLAGVKAGTHKFTVKLSYKQTKHRHGHRITVTVSKTLTTQFKVC